MTRKEELEALSEESLAEIVHDYKAREASCINNQGKKEQIKYILEFEMEE